MRISMSRVLSACALLYVTTVAAPQTGHAAGPPDNHGVPLGTPEPPGLPVRSATEQRSYDLKMQMGQMAVNHQTIPQALVAELSALTNRPSPDATGPSATPFTYTPMGTHSAGGVTPDYYYNGVYYATVDGGVSNYEEPTSLPSVLTSRGWDSNFYANMCGPGSATKLLSHFIPSTINSYSNSTFAGPGYTPQQTYMMYLAIGAPNPGGTSNPGFVWTYDGMMNTNDHNYPTNGAPNTQNGDEANVIDRTSGVPWYYTYGTDYAGDGASRFNTPQYSLSAFTGAVSLDVINYGMPMVMAADTHGLQGWWPNPQSRWAIHLVTINGADPSATHLWYFDSANNASAYGNSVNYFHQNWAVTNIVGGNNGLIDSVW